jgi:hypothetical protein
VEIRLETFFAVNFKILIKEYQYHHTGVVYHSFFITVRFVEKTRTDYSVDLPCSPKAVSIPMHTSYYKEMHVAKVNSTCRELKFSFAFRWLSCPVF